MKMQRQHYEELKSMIAALDTQRVAKGLPGYAKTAAGYHERELSPLRFRHDWLRGAVSSQWVCDVLYPAGINDDHIDSALRQIARELTGDKHHWSASK